jgi:hypothetical protein
MVLKINGIRFSNRKTEYRKRAAFFNSVSITKLYWKMICIVKLWTAVKLIADEGLLQNQA